MGRKVFWFLLCLAFFLPGVSFGADDGDSRPLTPAEAAEFESELANFGKELYDVILGGLQQNATQATPQKFVKNFKVKKKSSSPTRAARRAENAMKAMVKAYLNGLAQNGWIPLAKPRPGYSYSYKYGNSGFKFYCRIKATVTVWCAKMPQ